MTEHSASNPENEKHGQRIGTMLGPYRIESLIGAGGMGEVYRAKDTRLDRTVAVKVLSRGFAADAERLRRFEQEARTLAALNHPNILAVHDIGAEGGAPYLVSEFLEGETLREILDGGAMSTRRATDCALGVAHGLAAGHSKGVVHRDLKPENIFLTTDGRTKILDYGLARLAPAVSGAESSSAETMLNPDRGTTPGIVLGTVGYMSPEQVRGEPAEATSDIFSLGAVLYEMLSGKRAFRRDTAAETMTAILREEPPELSDSGWHGPPGLQRILERCMEKQPRQRFQSASDLAFAMESLSGSANSHSSVGEVKAIRAQKKPAWIWPVAAILLLAFLGAGWYVGGRMAARPLPHFKQITFQRGYIPGARFTHDGETVLYGGQFENDPIKMYSVRPNVLEPEPVPVPSAMLFSVSSGDQMAVGTDMRYGTYLPYATLSEVPITGGTPRPITDHVFSADYGPDGTLLALSREPGGRKCVVEFPVGHQVFETTGCADHLRVSPDGKLLAFDEHPVYGDDRGWITVVDRNGKARRLTEENSGAQGVAWRSNDEIYYTAAINSEPPHLMAVTLSGKRRDLLNSPETLRLHDITGNNRVLLSTEHEIFSISVVDPTGKATPNFEVYNGSIPFDITHDGSAVALEEFGGSSDTLYQVIYRKTDGSAPVILGKGAGPVFSPDGKMVSAILFTSPAQLAIYPIGMGQSRTIPLPGLENSKASLWFPDDKHLLVGGKHGPSEGQSHAYEVDLNDGSVKPWGPEGFVPMAISPDSKRVAGMSQGQFAIYDTQTKQTQLLGAPQGEAWVQTWTQDGAALLIGDRDTFAAWITRLDLATGKRTLIRRVESPDHAGIFECYLLTSDDGKAYAFTQSASLSTLWVVDGVK